MRKVFFLPYIIAVIVIGIAWSVFEFSSNDNLFSWLGWCRAISIILITVYNIITVIKTEFSQTQKAWMSMKFHIGWGGLLLAFFLVIYAEVKGDELIAAETAAVKQEILNRIDTSENQLHDSINTSENQLHDSINTSENQLHVANRAITQKTIEYIAARNEHDLIAEQKQLEFITNKHDSALLFARDLFKEVQHLDTLAAYRTQKFAEYLDSRSESLLVDLGAEISSRIGESEQRNAQLVDSFATQFENRMKTSEQATAERNVQLIKILAAHLKEQREQTMKILVEFISVRDSQRADMHERTLQIWKHVVSLLPTLSQGPPNPSSSGSNNNSPHEDKQ